MIKFIYEPAKTSITHYDDPAPVKELTMELRDWVSWYEATTDFHNFLRGAGYVIPYEFEEREWVGLEGEYEVGKMYSPDFLAGADWAEKKLKEKNT
jgi:hypothetical protein